MTHRISEAHLGLVTSFPAKPFLVRRSQLGTILLKLTQLYRDVAARAEHRRRVREIALGSVLSKSSPPGG